MKLKGKTRPQATTGEPLLTLFQSGQGEDLDALQVYEDGLLIHTNTQQKKRRYKKEFVPFASFEGAKVFFGTLHLFTKGQRGIHGVPLSDERTARELLSLAGAGISAAAHAEDGDEGAREAALEDLRERAEEARKIFGEDTDVPVREISASPYDPDLPERRAAIVGRLPVQDGSPAEARQDAVFVLSELRRHYASATASARRTMGGRLGFKAYWNLVSPAKPGEDGVAGSYAELGYIPEEDTFLLRLHNGLEDELSATTEDHVAEVLGEAAPAVVYIESFRRGRKETQNEKGVSPQMSRCSEASFVSGPGGGG